MTFFDTLKLSNRLQMYYSTYRVCAGKSATIQQQSSKLQQRGRKPIEGVSLYYQMTQGVFKDASS